MNTNTANTMSATSAGTDADRRIASAAENSVHTAVDGEVDIAALQPHYVWRHFATLCRIPRPSGHEGAIRDALRGWADARGLETVVDGIGNLIIRKPATPGYTRHPGVVLQGHLDMVCQKNADSRHDFFRDPIRPILRDGWLIAPDTTLGADNGLGVALALAVLAADDIAHPPLEVLLTVDEEAGMTGARGLAAETLKGAALINIDTEDWGEFYLGCAGGVDVEVDAQLPCCAVAAGDVAVELSVTGLLGGHSGVDIHLQRGNAIKLLAAVLHGARAAGIRFALAHLAGGTARNALPREATALLWLAPADLPAFEQCVVTAQMEMAEALSSVDEGVRIAVQAAGSIEAAGGEVLTEAAADTVLDWMHAAPHGVRRMSERVAGVVDTSNNLGVVQLAGGRLTAVFMVRSLRDAGTRALASEIASLCALAGWQTRLRAPYPGWAPNPASPLLGVFQAAHRRLFGHEAAVKVIHAGLECGIFTATYPKLDMISFGPTIRGAHAPGERVEVASVAQAWRLLVEVLASMPGPDGGLGGVTGPRL